MLKISCRPSLRLNPMNKNILSSLCLSALVLFASCAFSGQRTISVNGFSLTTPSQEQFVVDNAQLPEISSGVEGVDIAAEKVFYSKSKKSAILISSALINLGADGEDTALAYMESLKKQLEAAGEVRLNPRDGNNGIKIVSLVFAAGDVITDKVLFYSLDRPNALMIDFVFDKDEFESLSGAMSDLLDSISVVE